jgi:hypothetical protein
MAVSHLRELVSLWPTVDGEAGVPQPAASADT